MKYSLLLLCFMVSNLLTAQVPADLVDILQAKFPAGVTNKEEWIFYKDSANFEKLDYPLVKQYMPNYELYAANLSYKARRDWKNRWVIFYDSTTKDYIFQQSLTMSELNPKLQLILQQLQFSDSTALRQFINAFHSLRQIGSKCKFIQTTVSDTLLSYDVVWFDDQNYITRPYHDTNETAYDFSRILGKFYRNRKQYNYCIQRIKQEGEV